MVISDLLQHYPINQVPYLNVFHNNLNLEMPHDVRDPCPVIKIMCNCPLLHSNVGLECFCYVILFAQMCYRIFGFLFILLTCLLLVPSSLLNHVVFLTNIS
jgi:hypothetical protein